MFNYFGVMFSTDVRQVALMALNRYNITRYRLGVIAGLRDTRESTMITCSNGTERVFSSTSSTSFFLLCYQPLRALKCLFFIACMVVSPARTQFCKVGQYLICRPIYRASCEGAQYGARAFWWTCSTCLFVRYMKSISSLLRQRQFRYVNMKECIAHFASLTSSDQPIVFKGDSYIDHCQLLLPIAPCTLSSSTPSFPRNLTFFLSASCSEACISPQVVASEWVTSPWRHRTMPTVMWPWSRDIVRGCANKIIENHFTRPTNFHFICTFACNDYSSIGIWCLSVTWLIGCLVNFTYLTNGSLFKLANNLSFARLMISCANIAALTKAMIIIILIYIYIYIYIYTYIYIYIATYDWLIELRPCEALWCSG